MWKRASCLARSILIALVLVMPAAAFATPPSRGAREADEAVLAATRAGRVLLFALDHARRSGDASRVRCVDAKLSEANAFGRMILERRERLRAAEARGDTREAEHQARVIRVLSAQLRRAEREGRSCGVPSEPAGTVVTTHVSPDVPRDGLVRSDRF